MSRYSTFNPPELYGITRSFHAKTKTWAWKVAITRKGKKVALKNFADIVHGGEEKALAAAMAYRDKAMADHPPMSKIELCQKVRSTNTSGIAGVFRRQISENYAFWAARTQLPDGRILSRKFSINQYGEDGAKLHAIQERARQLACLGGEEYLHSPAARQLQKQLRTKRPVQENSPA